MAFRSSARRGRFDRQNIGDGGIQALQKQQSDVIKFLDLSRRQNLARGEKHIANLKGVANTESENARIIQNVENDIYKTKVDAINVAGTRDVQRLRDEAKMFEASSRFWGDFSGAGARALGSAAQGLYDMAEFTQGRRQYEKARDDGTLRQFASATEALYKIEDGKIVIERNRKDITGEEGRYLGKQRRSTNRYYAHLVLSDFEENKADYYREASDAFDRFLDQQEKEGNPVSAKQLAPEFYEAWATHVLEQKGVSPSLKKSQEFIDDFVVQGTQVSGVYNRQQLYTETQNAVKDDLKVVLSSNDENRSDDLSSLISSVRESYTKDDKGRVTPFIGNTADAGVYVFTEVLAKHPTMTRDKMNALLDTQVPGENITYREKLKNRNIEELVEEALIDNQKTITQRNKALDLIDDRGYKATVEEEINSGKIDSSTKEGRQELQRKYDEAKLKGYNESTSYIAELLVYDKESNVPLSVQTNLRLAAEKGDVEWFNSIYTNSLLSNKDRENYKFLSESVNHISDYKTQVEQPLNTILKKQLSAQPGRNWSDTLEVASTMAETQVLNEFYTLTQENADKIEKGEVKVSQLFKEAMKKVADEIKAGEGMWGVTETIDENGQLHFTSFEPDSFDFTTIDLSSRLNSDKSQDAYDNMVSYEKVNGKLATGSAGKVISDSQMINVIRDIENGQEFTYPENVIEVANHFGKDPREVMNDLLANYTDVSKLDDDNKAHAYVSKPPKELEVEKEIEESKNIENDKKKPEDSRGKSNEFCSAKSLYNKVIKSGIDIPFTADQRIAFASDSEAINAALEADAGLIEGRDYTASSDGNHYMHITPTSREGTQFMMQYYKKWGLEIELNGSLFDFTSCTFKRSL